MRRPREADCRREDVTGLGRAGWTGLWAMAHIWAHGIWPCGCGGYSLPFFFLPSIRLCPCLFINPIPFPWMSIESIHSQIQAKSFLSLSPSSSSSLRRGAGRAIGRRRRLRPAVSPHRIPAATLPIRHDTASSGALSIYYSIYHHYIYMHVYNICALHYSSRCSCALSLLQ